MADAVDHLGGAGEQASDELLAHTSPVGWEHIAFSGDYFSDRAAALPLGRRRPNLGQSARQVA